MDAAAVEACGKSHLDELFLLKERMPVADPKLDRELLEFLEHEKNDRRIKPWNAVLEKLQTMETGFNRRFDQHDARIRGLESRMGVIEVEPRRSMSPMPGSLMAVPIGTKVKKISESDTGHHNIVELQEELMLVQDAKTWRALRKNTAKIIVTVLGVVFALAAVATIGWTLRGVLSDPHPIPKIEVPLR